MSDYILTSLCNSKHPFSSAEKTSALLHTTDFAVLVCISLVSSVSPKRKVIQTFLHCLNYFGGLHYKLRETLRRINILQTKQHSRPQTVEQNLERTNKTSPFYFLVPGWAERASLLRACGPPQPTHALGKPAGKFTTQVAPVPELRDGR